MVLASSRCLPYPLTTTKCPMRLHSYWSQVTVSQEILLINRSSQPRGTHHRRELVKQESAIHPLYDERIDQ